MTIIRALLAGLALLLALPAAAAWRVAESAHFRVYGEQSETQLRERAALLEDYSALLRLLTNGTGDVDGAPRLDVFLVGNIAETRPFGRLDRYVGGYYTASAGRIAAFAETGEFGQTILLHEYTHHFMLGNTGVAYPKWYVEGFAEYFSTAQFKPATIEFGSVSPGRAMQLARGNWLPLIRVLARDPQLKGDEEVSAFYAESWLLGHYLQRMPGQTEKLRAYLRAVAAGADPLAAFQQHIDPDIRHFERVLKSYMTGRSITYSRFNRPAATPASITVTVLPPSADAVLLKLTSLELSVPQDPAKALAATRAAAARFPGDPLADRAVALAELRLGDRQAATTQIDALLVKSPEDPTLLRWRALAIAPFSRDTTPAARTEARRLLVRSFRADPSDWRTMLLYVQLANPRSAPLIANDLTVALRTHELAPQVGEVVITTAIALAQAGKLKEAAAVLEPLAYSAHGSGAAAFAARLLEPARADDKPGFIAALRASPEAAVDD